MSALKELLKQYGSGSLDDDSAVEKIKAVMKTSPDGVEGQDANADQYTKYVDSLYADDNDYDETWSEVTASHIAGTISDEQYNTLRSGVLPASPPPAKTE